MSIIYCTIKIFRYYLILKYLMNKVSFIRAIRKSGTSLTISIPPEMINLLNLKEGDFLKVEIEKIKRK